MSVVVMPLNECFDNCSKLNLTTCQPISVPTVGPLQGFEKSLNLKVFLSDQRNRLQEVTAGVYSSNPMRSF